MRSGFTADAILDTLGDPIRRVIFIRLHRAPATATELSKGLPVTRSAVSRHIGVLRRAGLVAGTRVGRGQIYAVCGAGLAPLVAWIARIHDRNEAGEVRQPPA